MKNFYRCLTGTAALLAAALIFAGCPMDVEEGGNREKAIPLTENAWTGGSISPPREEQWFKFTATAGRHYLHISFGTLTHLDVQVYDGGNNPVGDRISFGGSGSGFTDLTVTIDKVYYIKVTPYSGSGGGTYRIAFNSTSSPPLPPGTSTAAVRLTENDWANGAITSSNNEQWFTFTATAATQYIHVSFGTLTDLYVQVYDHNGGTPGNQTWLPTDNDKKYMSVTVTDVELYYIRVTPYPGSGTGTYRIAFNKSTTAPD